MNAPGAERKYDRQAPAEGGRGSGAPARAAELDDMTELLNQAFIDAVADAVVERIFSRIPAADFGGKRLLNIREAASFLGRTPDAVYQMVHRGQLPAVKNGRRVHIERAELEAWIERNRAA